MWGGIEIRVPEDWTVSSRIVPLMAGVEDKTRAPQGATDHRLVLRGFALMGGVEIEELNPMHPILARGGRLALYLGLWLLVSALLAALLAGRVGLTWAQAALVALPASLAYAFVCLSAWYVARGLPIKTTGTTRILLTGLVTSLLSSAVWLAVDELLALDARGPWMAARVGPFGRTSEPDLRFRRPAVSALDGDWLSARRL